MYAHTYAHTYAIHTHTPQQHIYMHTERTQFAHTQTHTDTDNTHICSTQNNTLVHTVIHTYSFDFIV